MGRKQCLTENAEWGYLPITLTIIGLIVLNVYPLLQTLVLNFSTTHPFGYYEVSRVEDYMQTFRSREFWKTIWNSIYFCILTVPLGIFLSLLTTVLLNAKIRAKAAFRTIYFLPMVVAPTAIAMVWKWVFNAEHGIINQIIGSRVNWLTNPKLVLPARAVVAVRNAVGYDTVLPPSGIQNISKSYYEAASLNRASGVEQFFKITLPMVSPTLFVVLIIRLMTPLRVYGLIRMMVDQTNPAFTDVQSLMYLLYRESFVAGNRGYTSTTVAQTMLLIGAVATLQLRGQKRRVDYEVQDGGKL